MTALDQMAGQEDDAEDYAYLLYDVALWHWHRDEYQAAFENAQRSLEAAEDSGIRQR